MEAAAAWRERVQHRLVRANDLAVPLLIGALAAAAILLIALGWQLTFFQDTWAVLLERQPFDLDSFLKPHNEHLIALQVLVQKLGVEIFGMSNARPEMLFMTATLLASGALLFVHARRRVGGWLALLASVLLLFLGSAWQVLLWPFEMEFTVPLAAGLGMLLVLDREDRLGDALACLLLIVAVGFGSLGLSFVLAAFVAICQAHRRCGWGRLYIVLVPAMLYLAWYFGWGRDAEHHITLHNILASPLYTVEGFASAVGALAGLSTAPVEGSAGEPVWGRVLLVPLVAWLIYRQWRRPGVPASFWPILAAALSYWLLAAFNFIPGREAASIRYMYAGAAFLLLLTAELMNGVRLRPRGLWVAAALTAVALLGNLAQLEDGYHWLKNQTVLTRADTGAMQIASRTMPVTFSLGPEIAGTPSLINVNAGQFLSAARDHGWPGYSPDEIAAAPESGRRAADVVLSQALPLSTVTVEGGYRAAAVGGDCVEIPPDGTVPEVPVNAGTSRILVAPGGEAAVSLRRFSLGEFPVASSPVPGGSEEELKVPRDEASTYPWYVHVVAAQPAWVCP